MRSVAYRLPEAGEVWQHRWNRPGSVRVDVVHEHSVEICYLTGEYAGCRNLVDLLAFLAVYVPPPMAVVS